MPYSSQRSARLVVRTMLYILLSFRDLLKRSLKLTECPMCRKDTGIPLKTQLWQHIQSVGVLCMMLVALRMGEAASTATLYAATPPKSAASDGPGALSYFDLYRKDCLGTARNTPPKVWFTLASGVLSDVYYPTIDNTNVKTLQYVVTDGSTFTDLQGRDTTYTVQSLNGPGLACQVTTLAKSG